MEVAYEAIEGRSLERVEPERFHPTVGAAIDSYLKEHAVAWQA